MRIKFIAVILLCIATLIAAIGIGSVFVSPSLIIETMISKLSGGWFLSSADDISQTILWNIRIPRVLLAFICGGALSVSGVVMQSVMRNPLASSYTVGISSGAAVGASIAMFCGFSFLGVFTIPFFGLVFGLATVFSAVFLASKMDKSMGSVTIILTGMAFSLFANSIITFTMAFSKQSAERLILWQLGSFALKDWSHNAVIFPVVCACFVVILMFSREMDIMTFGEDYAKASGVDILKVKWILLGIGAIMTGVVVSIAGVIGFVDLFVPHVARRFFGSRHIVVIPASVLLGGMFMVLCDLIARIVVSPLELPVGAVTSAIGAPFFIYLYFQKKGEAKC